MVPQFKSRRSLLRVATVVLGSGVGIGTAGADRTLEGDTLAEYPTSFSATLTSDAVAHPVESDASGAITLELDPDTRTVEYTVEIAHLCQVTQVRLHCGAETDDGPAVVWLYPESGPGIRPTEGRVDGTLAEGTLTVADFDGPFRDEPLEAVVQTLASEAAYVTVHTTEHPDGALRGRVAPDDAPGGDAASDK
ncbi:MULTISPECIES: CHRD domain-containing protein [Natrialbaceae]|uniref:CHRD domain-containing protein n=1 Tax=Natrialbaceae TaxID=1644061 RepID=UPI00207CEA8C|nr:CHRD domain-containing protein [Natronococcus sp. CG52]